MLESITISEVIEYLFCPRFIFFQNSLTIPQHEETRYKVQKGRRIHDSKEKRNKNYLRKKYHVIKKMLSVYLYSEKLRVRGIVDEVLFLKDGSACPLDYKYAEYKGKIFKTYKFQIVLYGLMIMEQFNVIVKKGLICYTKSNHLIKEIEITDKIISQSKKFIEEIFDIIQKGYFPESTEYKKRCLDCCYRNICPT